ncbi:chemotaxis protein CheW [Azoarcus communis]|uniref:Chemotaxis protein CheW n=1 Tax=Parazoarcus communis SWub3 = DSM 12120 TaxID=1121029 RepID=A0A323US48_9RHOO|nr:chemotaxis protein CheW [Parazoarcus communis]NMG47108.1 chemotaxis protein CheW [Parazoarcus communis]NMG72377.1 chemotaxis protein CheW [Parazoarcus communis SWub3 = DSM 12120]PZA14500.1 chemotaxis protein CheW [Azoarcus communis] [Parazoarcus communis SWub3 = DSM 12120]
MTATDLHALQPNKREFLTFTLADEEYALDILTVQEIRCYEPVTRIVGAPPFIKGVVNLRGAIVPIVDMRIKLALEKVDYTDFTVVIILSIAGRLVGIVVDSVSDVLALTPEQIRPAPELGSAIDIRYITGLATIDQRMVIMLDIARLMTSKEMQLLDGVSE